MGIAQSIGLHDRWLVQENLTNSRPGVEAACLSFLSVCFPTLRCSYNDVLFEVLGSEINGALSCHGRFGLYR